MKSLTHQQTRAQGLSSMVDSAPETIAQKLERTRLELRRAQENVQASEGRYLDFSTAETIMRSLLSASRDLQELTIAISIIERKVK
jgi:predicted component of type VI protein secretion system